MSTPLQVIDTPAELARRAGNRILTSSAAHAQGISNSGAANACWTLSLSKRILDILLSLLILAVFAVPMLLIAICIRLTSDGPAIFVQKRVGRGGRLFSIYKFRSMEYRKGSRAVRLTKSGDLRVTWVGRWLRRLKLDELPQFYNVLRGDMSIVGPRPKLPEFAEEPTPAYRPGITGAASLVFRREEEILASVPQDKIESFYHERIKPLKASIDARYAMQATFASDLRMIVSTVFASLYKDHEAVLQVHEVEMATCSKAGGKGAA